MINMLEYKLKKILNLPIQIKTEQELIIEIDNTPVVPNENS